MFALCVCLCLCAHWKHNIDKSGQEKKKDIESESKTDTPNEEVSKCDACEFSLFVGVRTVYIHWTPEWWDDCGKKQRATSRSEKENVKRWYSVKQVERSPNSRLCVALNCVLFAR